MTRTEHHRKLERMSAGTPCNQGLDIDISIEEGAAELRLTAEESMHHPAGGVHGSYSVAFGSLYTRAGDRARPV